VRSRRPADAVEGSGKSPAEPWVGRTRALLDLGLARDFLPKALVPQGGQLRISPAAVQGTLK